MSPSQRSWLRSPTFTFGVLVSLRAHAFARVGESVAAHQEERKLLTIIDVFDRLGECEGACIDDSQVRERIQTIYQFLYLYSERRHSPHTHPLFMLHF
jgi:hypothetical protein